MSQLEAARRNAIHWSTVIITIHLHFCSTKCVTLEAAVPVVSKAKQLSGVSNSKLSSPLLSSSLLSESRNNQVERQSHCFKLHKSLILRLAWYDGEVHRPDVLIRVCKNVQIHGNNDFVFNSKSERTQSHGLSQFQTCWTTKRSESAASHSTSFVVEKVSSKQ